MERLARRWPGLAVGPGDRVATLMWNSQEHLEAYFAVPCMGAVLHTLNLRLNPADLARIMAEAGDKVVMVHTSLLPLLSAVLPAVPPIEKVLVVADPGQPAFSGGTDGPVQYLDYEELLAAQPTGYEWPELDERSAAAICFTSGTTGVPRGVAYSHRSTFLHAFSCTSGSAFVHRRRGQSLAAGTDVPRQCVGLAFCQLDDRSDISNAAAMAPRRTGVQIDQIGPAYMRGGSPDNLGFAARLCR